MKALILTAALPLLACAARAQDAPSLKDIPAETVKKAHAAAWLGIAMTESDDKVVIGQVVPGSPADKAGLKPGDRVLRIGDVAVEGQMQRVVETVGQQKPGDTIEVRFLRGDKEDTVKIELAERPAQLDGDFRGKFRREKKIEENLKHGKSKLRDEYGQMEKLRLKAEDAKKNLEDRIELDPYKAHGNPDNFLEAPRRLEVNPDPNNPRQLLLQYLDSEWPHDKADSRLQLGFEVPLFEWSKGDKKGGRSFLELKTRGRPADEAAIWRRVEESVAHSLKKSGIGPDMVEKVMRAVEEARRSSSGREVRRTRLEAEAAKLDKEMESLRQRSDKVREELKKATE